MDRADIGQSVNERLREGELVKNLKVFLNERKKIIIEFRFRMMWRIMQITEDRIIQAEIHLASAFTASVDNIFRHLHNNSSRPTQPHSLIVN